MGNQAYLQGSMLESAELVTWQVQVVIQSPEPFSAWGPRGPHLSHMIGNLVFVCRRCTMGSSVN